MSGRSLDRTAHLTMNDLRRLVRRLQEVKGYLPNHTGECFARIDGAIDVVEGLADMWTRESVRNNRNKRPPT